jgi:modulator of FtsH protease HflK
LTQYNKAPEVTRQRLYIDAQEQIMSNTSKVLIDQKGGNSLLYLPLDKLMERTGAATQTAPSNAKTTATEQAEMELETNRSRDAFRSRDRDER